MLEDIIADSAERCAEVLVEVELPSRALWPMHRRQVRKKICSTTFAEAWPTSPPRAQWAFRTALVRHHRWRRRSHRRQTQDAFGMYQNGSVVALAVHTVPSQSEVNEIKT